MFLISLSFLMSSFVSWALPVPAEINEGFENSKTVELYSVNPVRSYGEVGKDEETIKDYPVYGKISLTGDDKRKVFEESKKGIVGSKGDVLRCFNPRHALRITTSKDRQVVLLISFECNQIYVYEKGERTAVVPTENNAVKVFNDLLVKAKVRLAE